MIPAHIALHNIFRAIIYLPLYLPCFLCLQFKQKIGAQALPTLGDDDDDDDDENPLAHSPNPEPADPPAGRPKYNSFKLHIRCNLPNFNPFSIKTPIISNHLFSSMSSTRSSNTSISKLNSMQLRLCLLLRLARCAAI